MKMFCPGLFAIPISCCRRCRLRGDGSSAQVKATRNGARRGLAITELVLIIAVPCMVLFGWALIDDEFHKSLVAGPGSDSSHIPNPVYAVIPVSEGNFVTLHSQGQLRFWNRESNRELGDLQSHLTELRCGAYSPEARLLAVGSAMGSLEVWNLEQPEQPVVSRIIDKIEVSTCQFALGGKLLVCADELGRMAFWDPITLTRQHVTGGTVDSGAIRSLAVSADGKTALAGTRRGAVQIWDLEARRQVGSLQLTAASTCPHACIESIAFLAGDRDFVAATHQEGISVWNLQSGQRLRQFAQDFHGIRSGTLSGDGRVYLAGNERAELGVWDLATGRALYTPQQCSSMVRALASDKQGLAALTGDWNGQVNWLHLAAQ